MLLSLQEKTDGDAQFFAIRVSSFAETIKQAREQRGLSQAEVAIAAERELRAITGDPAAKLTLSSYQKYEIGKNMPSTARADAIKKVLGLLPGQNDGGTGSPPRPEAEQQDINRTSAIVSVRDVQEMAYIPLVTVRANGGDGEEAFEEQIARHVAYDPMQLRRSGLDPKRLVLIPVSGNSMYPTLAPGDGALVQIYGGEPVQDGSVYVFKRQHYGIIIKRVFWNQEGELELRSDNPEGPTLKITPGSQFEWKVVGKVVRVEKNL